MITECSKKSLGDSLPPSSTARRRLRGLGRSGVAAFCAVLSLNAYACDCNHSDAERLVKAQACKAEETVDQLLDRTIKSSHRDLGWKVFSRNGEFDVERAFLVSKSMELRYRWHVDASGVVQPVSERAQTLCL